MYIILSRNLIQIQKILIFLKYQIYITLNINRLIPEKNQ